MVRRLLGTIDKQREEGRKIMGVSERIERERD